MLDRFLPRSPALASLRPQAPVYEEILDERADLLRVACGAAGTVERMGSADGGLEGFYRLLGSEALFLKVVPAAHRDRQVEAGVVARYLAERGLRASTCLPDYPRDLPAGQVLFASPYHEVRLVVPDVHDLARVGSSLERLHRILAAAPFASAVRQLREQRDGELAGLLQHAIADGVTELAGASTRYPDAPHQVVHGDLNVGNVVFPVAGGDPLLLDFEDCRFSHLPRLVDLAMALERFVLVWEDDDDRAFELGQTLVQGYRAAGELSAPAPGDLGRTLRVLSARALALLAAMRRDGHPVAGSEWEKFRYLLAQTRTRADLLGRLEETLR